MIKVFLRGLAAYLSPTLGEDVVLIRSPSCFAKATPLFLPKTDSFATSFPSGRYAQIQSVVRFPCA